MICTVSPAHADQQIDQLGSMTQRCYDDYKSARDDDASHDCRDLEGQLEAIAPRAKELIAQKAGGNTLNANDFFTIFAFVSGERTATEVMARVYYHHHVVDDGHDYAVQAIGWTFEAKNLHDLLLNINRPEFQSVKPTTVRVFRTELARDAFGPNAT